MPKCYSDQEREYIRKRLKEEAAACMGQFGIRRTTVDEYLPYPAVQNRLSITRNSVSDATGVFRYVSVISCFHPGKKGSIPLSCTRGNAITAEPVSWRVRILVQSL